MGTEFVSGQVALPFAFVPALGTDARDCSQYRSEAYTDPKCEDRLNHGLGAFVVLGVIVMVVGAPVWWFVVKPWTRGQRDERSTQNG